MVAVYGGDNKSSNSAWVAEILSGCDPPAWTVDSAVIYQLIDNFSATYDTWRHILQIAMGNRDG